MLTKPRQAENMSVISCLNLTAPCGIFDIDPQLSVLLLMRFDTELSVFCDRRKCDPQELGGLMLVLHN